jgi:hypothetical protein
MKTNSAILLAGILCGGFCSAQTSQNFGDATGEIHPNVGNHPHLDISSVVVTASADGSTITFRINLSGNPVTTDWGKYLIGIRSGVGGATAGNGWGRPINFAPGMTHWIGSWVDGGNGGQTWTYSSGSWSQSGSPGITKDATGVTLTESAANLGLVAGETMTFDVYSSGGSGADSAVDALSASSASITGWSGPYSTGLSSAASNAALQFTMPGELTFANWITGFGLAPADQDPGDDPDGDGLTNQQEFDADLDLNPNSDDTDFDSLTDDLEDGSMVYNGPSDTGTFPAIFDSDGDGYGDGDEVSGASLGFVSDPTVRNFGTMTVAGNFPEDAGEHFAADGSLINTDMTRTADVDLIGQFGWTLDYRVGVLGERKYKFVGDHNWNNSWGVGGASGSDIPATFSATGIHRWTFNSKNTAYSLQRVTFASQASFLAAYGLPAAGDADLDGVANGDEFAANTDPLNPDTDGDGKPDNTDPFPLVPGRNVVFSVNMNVQEALGNFNPATETVTVDFFDGIVGPLADLVLSDPDEDGIFTGTLSDLAGATNLNSGGYKFKIVKPGDDLFENSIGNRSFVLGAGNPAQTLPTVYFDNLANTYIAWAATNAGGQAANLDFDFDGVPNGVEFFMGETGSTFTANPGVIANVVTWPKSDTYTGTYGVNYVVQTSGNLSTWTDVAISSPNLNNGDPLQYTLPANSAPLFVRLKVVAP